MGGQSFCGANPVKNIINQITYDPDFDDNDVDTDLTSNSEFIQQADDRLGNAAGGLRW